MPTSKKTISERQFQDLVRQFRRLQAQSESTSVDSKIQTYWRYGNLIAKQRLSEELGYHNSVLRDLARETGISLRTLQQSAAFRASYQKPPTGQNLAWSHFRVLARLPSEKQKNFYARLAKKEGWTSKELQQAIASDLYSGGRLAKPRLERPKSPSFLYEVERVRVIDGDTVEALIDLGFDSFSLQRLRLAQLNAKEITTAAGRAARNFLAEILSDAGTIIVQTRKADLHGRYVAHLFVYPRKLSVDDCFEDGLHVNDLLVRKKHARVVG